MPDPSLGDQPRDRAHTTRLLGAPHPAEPAILELARLGSLENPASIADRKTSGPVVITTSLKLAPPERRVRGVRDSEGIAFTAVSPFY